MVYCILNSMYTVLLIAGVYVYILAVETILHRIIYNI